MALNAQQQAQLNQLYAEGLVTLEQMEATQKGILEYANLIAIAEEQRKIAADEQLAIAREAYRQSAELTDDIEAQLGIRRKNNKEERELAKLTNSVSSTLGKQIKDYNKIGDIHKDIAKNNSLVNELQQKAAVYAGERSTFVQKHNSKLSERRALEASLVGLSGEELEDAKDRIHELDQELDTLREQANERERLAGMLDDQAEALKDGNEQLSIQLANVKKVNNTLGVTGAVIGGLESAFNKLGVGYLADDFKDIKDDMTQLAAQGGNAGQVMVKGFAGVGTSLAKSFADPLVSIGLMIKAVTFFKDILLMADSNINTISKSTGLQEDAARKVNQQIIETSHSTDNLYMNTQRLSEGFAAAVEQTGLLNAYTGESLETFTSLTQQLGFSGQEADKLGMLLKTQGKETEATMENVVGVVNNFNLANKSALSAKDVLKDVANVSDAVAVSLGQSPEAIAEAVVAAKSLGLSLEQVDNIASGLLNIQSSLQAEMEAELLLGQNLNLERARGLALQNDMKGLAEEIGNQEQITNAFRTGNRIQQEAAAKALGMSRDELAKMIMLQDQQKMSQEEFIATYGEQSYEQMQQLSAQEKMNEAMMQFKMTMADVMTEITPIIQGIASFVAGLGKSKTAANALKLVLAGLAVKGMITAVTGIYQAFSMIPFGLGIPLAIGAVVAMNNMISSSTAKAKSAKDFRQRSGGKPLISQTLGGLVQPAIEDDIVMGPGIIDKVEAAEKGLLNITRPTISTSVLDSKASAGTNTIIQETNTKELEKQNKMMTEQLKQVNKTLTQIGNKNSDSYFDSEKVTRNIGRSTAGFR